MVKSLTYAVAFILILMVGAAFTQQPADGENSYRLATVGQVDTTSIDTITSDAGRGVWVASNPDLDNDGKPEIIVTEYTGGGRVFVFEMVGDNRIEYVWSSPDLPIENNGSTPRTATSGDFDNDGNQEIIFPIGYFADDSVTLANRGIYFYEFTGNDDDYGTEPAFRLTYEFIDSAFAQINTGRTESGLRCLDIDGDGRQELLFPPRSFDFAVAKMYILQVTSGTFETGDAVVETEYVYEDMVQVSAIAPDGYVPVGTDIGDVDSDGLDEIIVAGWQNIGAGAGIGFIQIDGEDSYTPGSILHIADFSAFVVKANPLFTMVNDEPVIYLHGTNASTSESHMWVMDGIISDQFVTEANLSELFANVGFWSAWDVGDQDHPTDSEGDGIDLYLYGGGGTLLDIEYDGEGLVTDVNSYTTTQVYDLADVYDNVGGLFNDIFTYPGMDLDADGKRDIVAAYKGSAIDTLGGKSMAQFGFHAFFFEWGDSTASIDLDSLWVTSIEAQPLTLITPDDYKLEQNYPNPFNPTTNIRFVLPVNKQISLKVYNSIGQEVRTLIDNENFSQGSHTVLWDGLDNNGVPVASGVYIYQLFYGNFSQSKKMTLVR
jgi:hypothetical protein